MNWMRLFAIIFVHIPLRYGQELLRKERTTACFGSCRCQGDPRNVQVDCHGSNLTWIPALGAFTTQLDISKNHLNVLPEYAFSHLKFLQLLSLADNNLETLPRTCFMGIIHNFRFLNLQNNKFKRVPSEAFQHLQFIEHLQLTGNVISEVPSDSFVSMQHLKELLLNDNRLTNVPEAIASIPSLQALTLDTNMITSIPEEAFLNSTGLSILFLHNNRIRRIEKGAFGRLHNLTVLRLGNNSITETPNLTTAVNLEEIILSNNLIGYIGSDAFSQNKKIRIIKLGGNPILSVGHFAFSALPRLQKIVVSGAREQVIFPNMSGNGHLHTLIFDQASIQLIPSSLCLEAPNLTHLDVHANRLRKFPDLGQCRNLVSLDLKFNLIRDLGVCMFNNQSNLRDLIMSHNAIHHISREVFRGLHSLTSLDLQHNKIQYIHPDAFLPLISLQDINLSGNEFDVMPSGGLRNVRHIKVHNNLNLKDFPGPEHFPHIMSLTLAYAYHCCQFISGTQNGNIDPSHIEENITFLDYGPHAPVFEGFEQAGLSESYSSYDAMWFNGEITTQHMMDYQSVRVRSSVTCLPMPGPFQPCMDLMGWWFTRCGAWTVFLLALIGNITVLGTNLLSKKIKVPRFLVCHLAFADLLMGVYLAILAILDAATFGDFRKHAVDWQGSSGCKTAGFLAVFSSMLSVYTLVVITIERLYAITHTMNLERKLSFPLTGSIMASGWLFAIIMAALPLFGISDYRKCAVCLPFETSDAVSLGYVAFLLLFNLLAFLFILVCYGKIYWSIRGSNAWHSNDSRIARRMGVLIFTDMLCWFPISFVSLTALVGLHLVSLEEAKIFLIFVLPINACANPFLYAILTKQFQQDFSDICRRLEETSEPKQLNVITDETSCDLLNSQSVVTDAFDSRKPSDSDTRGGRIWILSLIRRLFRKRQSTLRGENRLEKDKEKRFSEECNPVIQQKSEEKTQDSNNIGECFCHNMVSGVNQNAFTRRSLNNEMCIAPLFNKRHTSKRGQSESILSVCLKEENILPMNHLDMTSHGKYSNKRNDTSKHLAKRRKSQNDDPTDLTYKRGMTLTSSNSTDITYVGSEYDTVSRCSRGADHDCPHTSVGKDAVLDLGELAENEEISEYSL